MATYYGCKYYTLKPIADDKAYSGFLIGYATQNSGYTDFVPSLDKVIVSVHVVFNEVIPDPTADYFAELEKQKMEVTSQSHNPADLAS